MNRTHPFQTLEKGVYRLTAPYAQTAKMKRKKGIVYSLGCWFFLFWSSKAWNSLSMPGEKEIKYWKKLQALHTIPIGF